MCYAFGMSDAPARTAAPAVDERFSEELAPLLIDLWTRLRDYMSDVAADLGLPVPLVVAIRYLDPDRPRPMNELAEAMGCDPSHVTGITDDLEELGLARRHPATHDRRVKELRVTEAGVCVQEEIDRHLDRVLRLSALDPRERATLLDLLARLLASPTDRKPSAARRKPGRRSLALGTGRRTDAASLRHG